MAAKTCLSLVLASILLLQHSHIALGSTGGYADVVMNQFHSLNPRSGSRLLAEDVVKGDHCDPTTNNVCSNTPAKDNTQLLSCCNNHCRNVLTDRNNCGSCGTKCGFGQLCCGGRCTVVAYDVNNCGKCGEVCKSGVRCEYGSCGYA